MASTKPRKAFCAVEYAKTMSVITIQRIFRRRFGVDPPDKNSIKRWHTQRKEAGCLRKDKSTGTPHILEKVCLKKQQKGGPEECSRSHNDMDLIKSTSCLTKKLEYEKHLGCTSMDDWKSKVFAVEHLVVGGGPKIITTTVSVQQKMHVVMFLPLGETSLQVSS
ncbi:DUF4817 domain-containing protein [Trichonephila clavipes]|nr:DUF4817 domain-containing protein [Trichonephila clavipes]